MDELNLDDLMAALGSSSRRNRQDAAHRVAEISESNPQALVGYADQLVDGLARPEAQTRWELLNALAAVAAINADAVADAEDDAEAALFDEDSSMVRLGAFRYFCSYGASSPTRSREAWPLLDEAVQVYHGDVEFRDMLVALLGFAQGDLDPEVKAALADRVEFDAQKSTMPFIKNYSEQILDACRG